MGLLIQKENLGSFFKRLSSAEAVVDSENFKIKGVLVVLGLWNPLQEVGLCCSFHWVLGAKGGSLSEKPSWSSNPHPAFVVD